MAEATLPPSGGPAPSGPAALAPVARVWRRVSASLVPVLAVVTALIVTVPLMVVTGGQGDIARGLQLAGTAYASLLEGSLGVALNPLLDEDDVAGALLLAETEDITRPDLLRLSSRAEIIVETGPATLRGYDEVIQRYLGTEALPDEAAFTALGERIPAIQNVGAERLRDYEPLIMALTEQERRDVSELVRTYAPFDALDDEQIAAIVAFEPAAADYEPQQILELLQLMETNNIVALERMLEQLAVLDALELEYTSSDADAIAAIVALAAGSDTGVGRVIELNEVLLQLEEAGVRDIEQLSNQLRLTLRLYSEDIITDNDVAVALREELPGAI